jgi:3-oxoadipate enol-lactonase
MIQHGQDTSVDLVADARVNGRRVSYLRRGAGEPLLLLQGMGGHHQFWTEPFLELLEPHFDVVAPDHRGIGASDRADRPFSIADLADDAAGLVAELGWSDAHVFGISLGGMVAQELVLRHPGAVRTLTIGCSTAGGSAGIDPEVPRRVVAAMATRNAELALRVSFEANLSPAYAADPGHFDAFKATSLAVKVPSVVAGMQFQAALAHDTRDRLPTVSAPTLVLHGTADEMLGSAQGELIAGLVPGARLELFDGVGHLFWWEQPERAAALLREHATGATPCTARPRR